MLQKHKNIAIVASFKQVRHVKVQESVTFTDKNEL